MAKVTLGKRPETFKRKVKFQLLDGTDGVMTCEFFYRTKKEFGELVNAAVEARGEPTSDKTPSLGDLYIQAVDKNASHLLKILKGWDIEGVELNLETAQQFCDELPGGAVAVFDAYRDGCIEGRLGN